MITSLNVATVYVLDKEEALDFYVGKLGLEVAEWVVVIDGRLVGRSTRLGRCFGRSGLRCCFLVDTKLAELSKQVVGVTSHCRVTRCYRAVERLSFIHWGLGRFNSWTEDEEARRWSSSGM